MLRAPAITGSAMVKISQISHTCVRITGLFRIGDLGVNSGDGFFKNYFSLLIDAHGRIDGENLVDAPGASIRGSPIRKSPVQLLCLPVLTNVSEFMVKRDNCFRTHLVTGTQESLYLVNFIRRVKRPDVGKFHHLLQRKMTKRVSIEQVSKSGLKNSQYF